MLVALGEKNVQAVGTVCEDENVDENKRQLLENLVKVYGKIDSVKNTIESFKVNKKATDGVEQLLSVIGALENQGYADLVSVDFSVINDMSYYNGIVFKGFVSGIPTSILSGGEYDSLMKKLGKNSGAIGFAVYLDSVKSACLDDGYDVQTVVLYDKDNTVEQVGSAVDSVVKTGGTALAVKKIPNKLRYQQVIDLRGNK